MKITHHLAEAGEGLTARGALGDAVAAGVLKDLELLEGAGDLALEVGLVTNDSLKAGGVGGRIALLAGFGTGVEALDVFLEGELEPPVGDGDGLDAEGLEVTEGLELGAKVGEEGGEGGRVAAGELVCAVEDYRRWTTWPATCKNTGGTPSGTARCTCAC